MSSYVKQHLPIILVQHMGALDNTAQALRQAFVDVDLVLRKSKVDCEFSGTTAVVSLLKVC